MILGLDLGNDMGWAKGDESGLKRWKKTKEEGMRWWLYHEWLKDMLKGVSACGFERVDFTPKHRRRSSAIMAGFRTVTVMTCFGAGVPCFGVPVSTLKKFAGAKTKEEMIAQLGMDVNHNTADAIWVKRWTEKQWTG